MRGIERESEKERERKRERERERKDINYTRHKRDLSCREI